MQHAQPSYWCEPAIAKMWLKTYGWRIVGRRAIRGASNIPAPRSAALYDLHDVACVNAVSASVLVQRINEWSGRTDAAGGGVPAQVAVPRAS